jgi:exopolysaccharide biosynthesis polyprenyl glycosylphosphotransferase
MAASLMPFSARFRPLAALRLLGDVAVASLALWLAFRIRIELALPFTDQLLPAERIAGFARAGPWLVGAQIVLLALLGLYDDFRPLPRVDLARRLVLVSGFQAVAGAAAIFLTNAFFSRSVLLLYALLDAVFLYLWRRFLDRLARPELRRVAVVGRGSAAREVARSVAAHRWHGLVVAGHVPVPGEPESGEEIPPELGPPLGRIEDLPGLLLAGAIDDILLAPRADTWQTALVDSLAGVRPPQTSVLLLPGPFESLIGRMRYRWVSDLPVVDVIRESEWRNRLPAKRVVDMVAGGVLALLSLPLLALGALAVKLTSTGPVFHRQLRVGAGLAPFELWKLRTMRVGAEADNEERLAERGDPRLTPAGAWLRRFRIDELPQLAHVLSGKMSLVGPRPERPGFVQRYLAEVPGYRERFSVPPGLTGLAQVNGEYDSSPENKLRYDLAYIATWSPWLDLAILLRTVKIVLTSRGF